MNLLLGVYPTAGFLSTIKHNNNIHILFRVIYLGYLKNALAFTKRVNRVYQKNETDALNVCKVGQIVSVETQIKNFEVFEKLLSGGLQNIFLCGLSLRSEY